MYDPERMTVTHAEKMERGGICPVSAYPLALSFSDPEAL